jgi:peptide/nickel transport system ATP-binding protein
MEKETVKVEKLKKWFPVNLGFWSSLVSKKKLFVQAVDEIDFEVGKGEIFGLVGESGSGKTTTGRLILRLIEPTGGKVFFKGQDIAHISEKEMKNYRKKMQIIFQDPYESLNPKMTINDIISEPLYIQGELHPEDKVRNALEDVQLTPPDEFLFRYPHELSGGQRQRVAVARALVLDPEFIVADEPVSMLDVSIRAEVLNLMIELVEKRKVSLLFITHDLALSRHICDRIAVMYLGRIVEKGPVEKIIYESAHPYTRALVQAVPVPDPTSDRIETVIKGEIPSPVHPPSGCRFHTRCPSFIGEICRNTEPQLIGLDKDHWVACHLYSKK